jgi:hypothetical protein
MRKLLFCWLIASILGTASLMAQDIEQVVKAKPFSWTGSLGAGTEFYTSNAALGRYTPFAWQLNGNFNMTLFETFQLPFSFTVGKQQLDYRLPYLQMGMSPSYKWATLHVGYRNLNYSAYGLNGATFLGAGLELNPGLFRFGTMYGRFSQGLEVDTSLNVFQLPAYKRMGYGGKIGVGKENNYLDLTFFAAKDDTNSIATPDPIYNLTAQDNMIFGASTKQVLFKNLTFTGDYSISFLTQDLQADPGEENTPLKGNSSTGTFHAMKAALGYKFTNANLQLSYERVDKGYRSLGSFFFNDDFEHLLITPSWSMLQNKVSINLSAGLQRNNLKNDEGVQDFRLANSVGISLNPSQKFGLDVNYSNFSMNQRAVNNFDLNDTLRIINVTNNLNLTPRLTFTDEKKLQTVTLNYNFQLFNDKNIVTTEIAGNSSHFANLMYNITLLESQWTVFGGLNFNAFDQFENNLKQAGLSAGVSKSFLDNKLSSSFNSTYNLSYLNGAADGSILNFNANAGYTLQQKHSFNLTLSLLNNSSKALDSFYEFRGGLRYQFTIR